MGSADSPVSHLFFGEPDVRYAEWLSVLLAKGAQHMEDPACLVSSPTTSSRPACGAKEAKGGEVYPQS